jgi:hypothetical protein
MKSMSLMLVSATIFILPAISLALVVSRSYDQCVRQEY